MQPDTDTLLDRRRFLGRALLAGGLPHLAAGCTTASSAPAKRTSRAVTEPIPRPAIAPIDSWAGVAPPFPVPDLSSHRIVECVAGIRPFRSGRVRIEKERLGTKTLIHNYGQGGAGLTLSWGSAAEVVRLISTEMVLRNRPPSIAVLGTGVIGLTTAYELLGAGCRVRLYTKATLAQTTSWLAGGQWAPSLVARGNPQGDPGFFERMLTTSHERFDRLADEGGWGVFRRPNFVAGDSGGSGLRRIPSHLIPPVEFHDELPFAGVHLPGSIYRTMLIEPPIFLPRLTAEIEALGGETHFRTFASLDELADLPEPIVVNCLGLGARDILHDPALTPIRGQLVYMQPQSLPYLLSHANGHIFPRTDALILGGTVERGNDDTTADESACMRIVERNRRIFERRMA